MPSTPHFYRDCVAYVYATKRDAMNDSGFLGVGLIASVRSKTRHSTHHYYFVTNEHVIRGMDSIAIRVNTLTGCKAVRIARSEFEVSRPSDLAAAFVPFASEFTFCFISEDTFVKPSDLNRLMIGAGTDIFMVSRVLHRTRYRTKNLSALRFGNIALLPECEELFYLIETRSVAGHSGSPVLIYPTPFIFGNPRKSEEDFAPMLLGINRGHLPDYQRVVRRVGKRFAEHPHYFSEGHVAISHVVPAWYISQILHRERFQRERQAADTKLQERPHSLRIERVKLPLSLAPSAKDSSRHRNAAQRVLAAAHRFPLDSIHDPQFPLPLLA